MKEAQNRKIKHKHANTHLNELNKTHRNRHHQQQQNVLTRSHKHQTLRYCRRRQCRQQQEQHQQQNQHQQTFKAFMLLAIFHSYLFVLLLLLFFSFCCIRRHLHSLYRNRCFLFVCLFLLFLFNYALNGTHFKRNNDQCVNTIFV